jgi:nicotinamidase-related amidase
MQIPHSNRRRALALVDVQSAFVNANSQNAILNIKRLLEAIRYDVYIEAVFSAPPGSLWDRQTGWTLPEDKQTCSVSELAEVLRDRGVWRVHKNSKSIFSGDVPLAERLRSSGIEELHLVGFDLNDCVLASAFDSFDCGFYTYVIEECCAASSDLRLGRHATAILRHLHMTNNSQFEDVPRSNV